jgi:uncharacterized sulfatase
MKRRLTLMLAVLSWAIPRAAWAAESAPNVVLMIADDQGWTDYSFMGHPLIQTPNIDRLAAQGLTFRRGYVPSSLCSPSLASILTGLYAHQHRVTSNDPPLPKGDPGSRDKAPGLGRSDLAGVLRERESMISNFDRVPTLPRLLAAKGYVSLQTGKWWGGHYRHGGFTDGMTHGDPKRGGRHGDLGLAIGRETMQPIFDFVDSAVSAGKPFFVWYAPMLPHQPHNAPRRLLDKYSAQAPTLELAKYWANVEWLDETCGQLLDFLARRKLANETLVIFLADNGWIQDPTLDRCAPKSKQSPYDGGLRTPIIVRWPGRVQPQTCDLRVSSIDVAPTILAAAGVDRSADMRGIDLLDNAAVARRSAIFGEVFTHNAVDIKRPSSGLRYRWAIEGDWKLIVPAPQNTPGARVELYDLKSDPFETQNVAIENPPRVSRLTDLVDRWWNGRD